MCGIVGAVSERDVQGILLEGLRRLEYRGYDSAGMAVIDGKQAINRAREGGFSDYISKLDRNGLIDALREFTKPETKEVAA